MHKRRIIIAQINQWIVWQPILGGVYFSVLGGKMRGNLNLRTNNSCIRKIGNNKLMTKIISIILAISLLLMGISVQSISGITGPFAEALDKVGSAISEINGSEVSVNDNPSETAILQEPSKDRSFAANEVTSGTNQQFEKDKDGTFIIPGGSYSALPVKPDSYKLTGDVSISSTWEIPTDSSGTPTSLNLNGYNITMTGNKTIISVVGTTFTLKNNPEEAGRTGGVITGGVGSSGDEQHSGGGVAVGGTSSTKQSIFNLEGGTIQNCSATYGGGVMVFGQGNGLNKFNMKGGTIKNCTCTGANGDGGGIRNQDTVNISGGTIDSCKALKFGGGISNISTASGTTQLNITGGTISNCQQTNSGSGGGGAITNFASAIINSSSGNVNIKGNSAYYGGAIYNTQNTVTADKHASLQISMNVTIDNNTAKSNGGGIENNYTGSSLSIKSGTGCPVISNNTAQGQGGGIYTNNNTSIYEANFENNHANSSGGGLACTKDSNCDGFLQIKGIDSSQMSVMFNNNTTSTNGGGLFYKGGNPSSENCVDYTQFIGNKANGYGGAVCVNGESSQLNYLTFCGSTFTANEAKEGGAIHNGGKVRLYANNTITDNTARDLGGGISAYHQYNASSAIELNGSHIIINGNICSGNPQYADIALQAYDTNNQRHYLIDKLALGGSDESTYSNIGIGMFKGVGASAEEVLDDRITDGYATNNGGYPGIHPKTYFHYADSSKEKVYVRWGGKTKEDNSFSEAWLGIRPVLNVVSNSAEVTYDGQEHSVSGFETTEFVVEGETLTVSELYASSGSHKDWKYGGYENTITGTPVVKDSSGNIVKRDDVVVNTTPGKLVINKRNVTISSSNKEKFYDGTPLRGNEDDISLGGDGFANKEGATYDMTGKQIAVGESSNSFIYTLNNGTKDTNYSITKEEGTLSVKARGEEEKINIELTPNSAECVYDGNWQSLNDFESYEFKVGDATFTVDKVSVSSHAEGKDAGNYPVSTNIENVKVKDQYDNDITDQCSVSVAEGHQLTIKPRVVVLESGSDTRPFNGKALTCETCTVKDGEGLHGFADNEGITAKNWASVTYPSEGEVTNTFEYYFNDGTNPDNYEITVNYGSLKVTDRSESEKYQIELKAKSKNTDIYDGTEKSVNGFEQTEFTFEGVTYVVEGATSEAKLTNAGSIDTTTNIDSAVVKIKGSDIPVTDQFKITSKSGTLSINPVKIDFYSPDRTWTYDGSPHSITKEDISMTGSYIGKDYFDFSSFVTVTNVTGSTGVDNSFTYTPGENTIASNYDITTHFGKLFVTNRSDDDKYILTIYANAANPSSLMYDGEEHNVEGYSIQVTDKQGNVIAQKYTVDGAQASGINAKDAGTYTNKVSVPEGSKTIRDINGNDVSAQFEEIKLVDNSLEITPREITAQSASAEKEFDGTALTDHTDPVISGDGFVGEEGFSGYTFSGTQTMVGSSENTFVCNFKDNTKPDNYKVTYSYGTLTVKNRGAKYSITAKAKSDVITYDGNEHQLIGFVQDEYQPDPDKPDFRVKVSGLTASSGDTPVVDAGDYTVSVTGTAKVEDVATGQDISDQFQVSTENGTLKIEKRQITFASKSAQKPFDGTPLTVIDITQYGDGWATPTGKEAEGADVWAEGSRTTVGSSTNSIIYQLKANTKAANYDINLEQGTLTVQDRKEAGLDKLKIKVVSKSGAANIVYDGNNHAISGFAADSYIPEGTTAAFTVDGLSAQTDEAIHAATYNNVITGTDIAKVMLGTHDVTDQFELSYEEGTVIVKPCDISLQSNDAYKTYDGEALTCEEVVITKGAFVGEEGLNYSFTGKQLVPGSSENFFTYTAKEGTNLSDYNIKATNGTLTVNSRSDTDKYQINIVSNSSKDVKYDGATHTVSGFENEWYTPDPSRPDFIVKVQGLQANGTGINAGKVSNAITLIDPNIPASIIDEYGNDVSSEFIYTTKEGSFNITKRTVELTSASAEKTYDATPLSREQVYVTGDGFAVDEGLVYENFASVTNVVDSPADNTFTYRAQSNTNLNNYEFAKTLYGILRINPVEITINIEGRNLTNTLYNGQTQTVEGFIPTCSDNFYASKNIKITEGKAKVSGKDADYYYMNLKPEDFSYNDPNAKATFVITKDGYLQIDQRAVYMESATDEKVYDGTPLSNHNVEVTGDGFVDGEGVDYNFTESITNVGSVSNDFTYKLKPETKNNNYLIHTPTFGTLTVTARPVVLLWGQTSWEYDWNSHSTTCDISNKVQGDEVSVELNNNEITNVSESPVTVEASSLAGKDAGNYELLVKETRELNITPKSLAGATVILDGAVLTYDGDSKTQDVASVLLEGHELEVDKDIVIADNSATEMGVYQLSVNPVSGGNFKDNAKAMWLIIGEGFDFDQLKGNIVLDVNCGQNVPLTKVNNTIFEAVVNTQATADELSSVAEGSNLHIWLNVVDNDKNISAESKAAFEEEFAKQNLEAAKYLDIKLFKQLNTESPVHITDAAGDMKLSMDIPKDYDVAEKDNSYDAFRNHEMNVDDLNANYDKDTRALSFTSDKFSDYAISRMTSDVPGPGPDPTPSPVPEPEAGGTTQTGDLSTILLGTLSIIAVLAGAFVLLTRYSSRRRKSRPSLHARY